MARLALIAGGGSLPGVVTEACRRIGMDFFVVALKGFTDAAWANAEPHKWFRLGQVGAVLDELKKQQIDTIVFAGHIKRPSFNSILRLSPDVVGLKLLWRLRRKKMGDDSLLREISAFFQEHGIKIVGANDLVPDSLMPHGMLTARKPDDAAWRDINYAAHILRAWGELDQGQSIVVQDGVILGVEAAEGTDELIRRCGQYRRKGAGPVLIKMKKPQQDRRLDMPTIGENTIRNAIAAGFSGIAVQAHEAIFLHPVSSAYEADNNSLFIVGFSKQDDAA